MKQNEFALVATAGVPERVTIYRDPVAGGGWTVWAIVDSAPWDRDYIEAARGGKREWVSLDTAHRWVRDHGWTGNVTISEASPYHA